jgi:ubiquinone/menaquinone biosynthesis C-methylase UbiE
MDMEALAAAPVGRWIVRALGTAMDSRLRHRFFGPLTTLQGADMHPGQTVLEVGCGSGFFTIPAARLLGDQGRLIAMDVLSESVDYVSEKVRAADLKNVRVIKGDAAATGLDAGSIDTILLFGVIPAPTLPLARLLPELHRVLKAKGTLAVWPPIPVYLPQSVLGSGLFAYAGRRSGVHNFRAVDAASSSLPREPSGVH